MGFNTGLEFYILLFTAFIKGVEADYYYYYTYYEVSPTTIGSSIASAIVGLGVLVSICVCCCKRSQGNSGTIVMNTPQPGVVVVSNTSQVNPGYFPGMGHVPQYPGTAPQHPDTIPLDAPSFPGGPPAYTPTPSSTPAYGQFYSADEQPVYAYDQPSTITGGDKTSAIGEQPSDMR